ncbi:MAG: methyltransferase, partial [Abditibacteriales bacterium]|nr:methyltransferase [Abditibacteriales bacterium]
CLSPPRRKQRINGMVVSVHTVAFRGAIFHIPDGVPLPSEGSRLLAEALVVRPHETVLDVGTGCGFYAVIAAKTAEHVWAVDVLPACVECARRNAERNGVAGRVTFLRGSLFEPVRGRAFDLIVSTPPQMPSLADEENPRYEGGADGRRVLDALIAEAPDHLNPNGRLLFVQFGFLGVEKSLQRLRAVGLMPRLLAERETSSVVATARIERLQSLDTENTILWRDGKPLFKRFLIEGRKL